jgi:hypothetical protein
MFFFNTHTHTLSLNYTDPFVFRSFVVVRFDSQEVIARGGARRRSENNDAAADDEPDGSSFFDRSIDECDNGRYAVFR